MAATVMQRFLNDEEDASVDAFADGAEDSLGGEEEEGPEFIAFGMLTLAMALGIITRPTLEKWLPSEDRGGRCTVVASQTLVSAHFQRAGAQQTAWSIPYAVLLLAWGGVFGLFFTEFDAPYNSALKSSIRAWISFDPRYYQLIFFPILIFVSALNGDLHILARRFGQVLTLAVPGVVVGAVLTSVFAKYVFPYDWDWNLALVFGAIVTTTDPVAIVALLEDLGVSEKLYTLIEGESHYNDGAAIVIFEVFLENLEGYGRSAGEVVQFAARLALGGPAIGLAIGLLGSFVMGYLINDVVTEVSLTLLLSYGTFALCESTTLKVSGALGLVHCALMLSYYGKPRVSSPVLPSLHDFWKTLQWLADTVIFFLAGLVVVGVSITADRAIATEDIGYLFLLFIALYIIRAFVVFLSCPVLRHGEYKMTVPQMIVLTHSGLRGAVALILAIVVDGVYAIEDVDKDRIVFLTAGIVVLSLVANGTTISPLVRYLKLDRASDASQAVFRQSCLALELSMQKHQKHLRQDPFLADANWDVVWRYLPLFTAESYWTRLSTGSICLSRNELDNVRAVNARAGGEDSFRSFRGKLEASNMWGSSYNKKMHHRYLFDDAGGEAVWGNLASFLAAAGDKSAEVWAGHINNTSGPENTPPHGEEKTGESAAPPHSASVSSFEGEDHDRDDNVHRQGAPSERMFQRATTTAHEAGGKELGGGMNGQEINASALQEARLRFLRRVKAEVFKAKREGKLDSSGLRVLRESIDTAMDKAENGSELDVWSELRGRFSSGFQGVVAKYFNWWPARALVVELIALWLSFQINLAYNFLEAHRQSSIKSVLAARGAVDGVQRQLNIEIKNQVDNVEACMQKLVKEAPLIVLSAKTRKAARIMLEHYREEMETLAENGHLDEKEEEFLKHAITNSEILISYHPTLESLPDLGETLEKVEFLRDLLPEDRQRLIDIGACYYHEYVGDVVLVEMGKLGARGIKRSGEKASSFRGWFYVARGLVEKQWRGDHGGVEYANYSMGTVFGITDTMLGRPHHAGYKTRGFSQLVVFDQPLLLQAAEKMPELDYAIWRSVAAHCLRRESRFQPCRLHYLHGVLSGTAFLSGKAGVDADEVIEMAANDAIVLVRGKITDVEGVITSPLGGPTANSTPVLVEPIAGGNGCSIKVSGDYKAFKLPPDSLGLLVRGERQRMTRQESMERGLMLLSDVKDPSMHRTSPTGPHDLGSSDPDEAGIGAEEAMELLSGLKRNQHTHPLKKHTKSTMGPMISRLVDILSGLKEKRLLLLGLDAAGKTSLLYKLHLDEVVHTIPTVGFNVERVEYNRMMMTIWDIGGQTKLRPLWRHYYINTDALIFVVDSSDLERIEEARDEMFHVLRDPNMDGCQTVLILLNKQDLPGAIGPSVMISKLGLDSAGNNPLKRRNWYMQACCAITGEGVFDGLDWLCQAVKKK
eukprot:g8739.t1